MARTVWQRFLALGIAWWLSSPERLLELFRRDHDRHAAQSLHPHTELPSVLAGTAPSLDAVIQSGNVGDAGGAFPVPLLKPRVRRHPAYDYGWDEGWAAIRANERHRWNAALLLLLAPASPESNATIR